MTARRQFLAWALAALAALLLLIAVLFWGHRDVEERWNTFLVGDPKAGAEAFRQKGCSDCHAVCGMGTKLAPDLAMKSSAGSNMNLLVTRLWNHVPIMWQQFEKKGKEFPRITAEETADLFAYLYSACYARESGNSARGKVLFSRKGCIRCHRIEDEGGKVGPDLKSIGPVDTPIFWVQEMWNHAPAMEADMREFKLAWPRFDGEEMNDLLAYIREERAGPQRESDLLPADPDRGWTLFQKKGCIACHAVRGQGGSAGPDLGTGRPLPPTLTQVAGQMWNHSPEMWARMKKERIDRPVFEGREMADVIAFLYSLRSYELGGSPSVGKALFNERKCSRCHGAEGRGGEVGPNLRRRGRLLTPVNLARALWAHGPEMYRKSTQLGVGWPTMKQGDLEHLLAFLNAPPEKQSK
ncbi:MAG: c-type cytochrome [Acidobacteria bacterium]|nr:c-type cytochrome [Acidobacteriota bacterium]